MEHTFAGDRPERVEVTRRRAGTCASVGEVLPQRPDAVRPVVVQGDAHGVRMALRARARRSPSPRARTSSPPDTSPRSTGNEGSPGSTGAEMRRNARRPGRAQRWWTTKRPCVARSSLANSDMSRPPGRPRPRSASAGKIAATHLEHELSRVAARGRRAPSRQALPARRRAPVVMPSLHDPRRRVDQVQQRPGQVERGDDGQDAAATSVTPCPRRSVSGSGRRARSRGRLPSTRRPT